MELDLEEQPTIPPVAIDIKVHNLNSIDVLEATFQATLQLHVVWRLPHQLWGVLADANTGEEVRAELNAVGEWPRFVLRGLESFRERKIQVSLIGKKTLPSGRRKFRSIALPFVQSSDYEAGNVTAEAPPLEPTPKEGTSQAPIRGAQRFSLDTQLSSATLMGTQSAPMLIKDEVFVSLKINYTDAEISTSAIGDEEADIGVGALYHPFDCHRIVFAVDLDAPPQSIAHWPESPAFSAGWAGWAWYEGAELLASVNSTSALLQHATQESAQTNATNARNPQSAWNGRVAPAPPTEASNSESNQRLSRTAPGKMADADRQQVRSLLSIKSDSSGFLTRDISHSSFHLSMSRLFAMGQNKKGRSIIRREWRRVGEPDFWPREQDFVRGEVESPVTCEFYTELERIAPLSLFVSELFKPFLLVVLGSLKYAVPIDEVADRASVDFVLLLIFYEASDVGLPGVFDLLDVYTSTCFIILFISTFETFAAHELNWHSDYFVLAALSSIFVAFNLLYISGIAFMRTSRHKQARTHHSTWKRRPKIQPLPKKLRIVFSSTTDLLSFNQETNQPASVGPEPLTEDKEVL